MTFARLSVASLQPPTPNTQHPRSRSLFSQSYTHSNELDPTVAATGQVGEFLLYVTRELIYAGEGMRAADD